MTDWSIIADPLISPIVIGVFALLAFAVFTAGVLRRRPGAWLRGTALALVAGCLVNPSLRLEERERQPTVIAVVEDASASQTSIDPRQEQTAQASELLKERLSELGGVEIRTVTLGTDREAGTLAIGPLQEALADVPREQIGGAVLITDGQIADLPAATLDAQAPAILGDGIPIHALITGVPDEGDRRIELLQVPRFTLVDRREPLVFRVVEDGAPLTANPDATVRLSILRNNEILIETEVPIGVDIDVPISVDRAGDNLFELRIAQADGELTELNNQATFSVEGVRDTLRVLLVSGQPHAGERTWRNLLKSDPAVDLVHFTILRPPEKQDGTPIGELSLIAFPTRELFVERINDFDLIILDRYQRRSVLPLVYFDNIADYVRRGGALLIAAGPEFADETSIAFTALADVLPVFPTGEILEAPFHPRLSEIGRRHPITRGLEGAPTATETDENDPDWSRWFRLIAAEASQASTVAMRTPIDAAVPSAPLLALDKRGDGRVAVLLSDHIWLWARNFEGGGPHVQLLRRTAHWLMREPDLEDETLQARVVGERLLIERRTLADSVDDIDIEAPGGEELTVSLDNQGDGLFSVSIEAREIGLWRLTDGTLSTLAHVGPPNPNELQTVVSSTQRFEPIAAATRSAAVRLQPTADGSLSVPRTRLVDGAGRTTGSGWIGFRRSEASVLLGARQQPLTLGLWTLIPALMLWGATWWREGR